jgi:predicted ATPase/DNA-binding winged helix-turn-helix (wHTH) protein/tetratricopeptide (TPR) repeat protein
MTVWTFGPFTLDEQAGRLSRDGVDLKPQPLVIQLLVHAARHPGELLTRDALTAMLWPDVVVTDHSLSQLVHRVRKHLGPHRAWWATVPRRGYRFDAPLTKQSEPLRVAASGDSFHGREAALRWLDAHVQPGAWVQLKGPGGIGKTRLARERVRSGGGDALWIELADVVSRLGLIERIGGRLDVELGGKDDLDRVRRVVARRAPALVVFDNLEQLEPDCDAVFETLRSASPTTTWLATSRSEAGVRGAVQLELAPLDRAAAESVFRARAAFVGGEIDVSDEAALADVLDALLGLPLALELAAARTAVLDLPSIAERLGEALAVLRGRTRGHARHRSLEATVRWSWDLLDTREQHVLMHLALFPTGASVDTLERMVALRDDDPADVLDVLQRLQTSSLVDRGARWPDGRVLVLHPVVRAFVLAELAERDDRWVVEQAFADVLAERMQRVMGLQHCWEVDLYTVLKADLPNVGEALARVPDADALRAYGVMTAWISGRMDPNRWLDPTSTTPLGLRARAMASSSRSFEAVDADLHVGVDALLEDGRPDLASDLFRVLAVAAVRLGKHGRAVELAHAALDLAVQAEDAIRQSWAYVPLGGAAMRRRMFPEALAACESGLASIPPDTHDRLTATLLDLQGLTLALSGEPDRAVGLLQRAHAAAERVDLDTRCGSIETNLATLHEQRGEMDEAIAFLLRARKRFRALSTPLREAIAENNLALYEVYRGRMDAARQHLDAARALNAGPYVEGLLVTTESLWMLHAGRTEAALTAVDAHLANDGHSDETRVVLGMIKLLAEHALGRPTDAAEALLDGLPVAEMRSGIPAAVGIARMHARGQALPELNEERMLARSLRRLLASR